MSLLLSLPVLLVGAVLALALRESRRSAVAAIGSQALATALVLGSVLPILGGKPALQLTWPWPAPIESIAFRIDALGAFFLAWSLPMTLLGTIYATAYLQPYYARGRHGGPQFALLNLVQVSFVLIYSVQNALVFLLGWEIAAVAAWLLVIWDYQNQKIRFAGFNYLVSTHVGLFVLVAAFMLLHSQTDSMDFARFGGFLARPSPTRGTLFLLLGVAFALKSAFFPFHTWLPRAHSAAPAHVSALMSGVIHKAGLFAFLRFTLLSGRPDEWMGYCVLGFGLLSAFFGVLYTAVQRDLKRLLGYSSTENVGIAAIGFGVGYLGMSWDVPWLVALGFGSGLLHLLYHACFKCLLFYAAGSVYRATRSVDLERLGGLAKHMPRTALLFLIGALGSAGLPPFSGFISEYLVYASLFSGRAPSSLQNIVLLAAGAMLAFSSAVSAFSMARAFGVSFLGQPRDRQLHVSGDAPLAMLAPMALLALLVLLFGLAPELALRLIGAPLQLFTGARDAQVLAALLAPVVGASRWLALGLLAAVALALYRRAGARRSVTWACAYPAGTPRMQYTASAFSEQLARIFETFLPALRRERLPKELFPSTPGHLSTHHVDPVERRIFEVLGQGEDMIVQASEHVPEQPHFAFAAGLLALLIIGALLFGGALR